MKRFFALALIFIMLIPLCLVASADTYVPSRTINLVYDDSGSMIGKYIDTWCQAKYAMEVFAAMLGENETLNIYYMSDYDSSMSAPPRLSLKGSKNASVTETNVQKIHDLVTPAGNTPFKSVKKAYEDLKQVTSDERWLVVLTDGAFNDASDSRVQNYFEDCVSDGKTRVMMLSMGAQGAVITPAPDKNLFFEKTEDTTEIPGKLTKICNRIFQRNSLTVNRSNEVSFNVPMSQLIVFAQGENVQIDGITSAAGGNVAPSSNVHVQHSKVAATNRSEYLVAENLNGYVATFNTDFAPGTYKVNVSGAEDVQVYYKPNVSIAAYLYDGDGQEVTGKDTLPAGTYRLEFGFVNGTNGEKVTDTSLLGNIVYESYFVNTTDSDVVEIEAKSGDTVTIQEGQLDIDVTARFLEYNTVNTKLSFQIFSRNDLIFSFDQKPTYTINTEGFTNPNDPIILRVKIDSPEGIVELTKEQWDLLGMVSVTTTADLGPFRVERTDEIGKYMIYPTLKDNDPMKTDGGTIPIKIEGEFEDDLASAYGVKEDSFEIQNTITTMERLEKWLRENWLKLTIWSLVFLLILGYIPPFKKYLPRKVKQKPLIKCKGLKIGAKDFTAKGTYKISIATTLIPYKAETGSIAFSPAPRKVAKVKALGGRRMLLTNSKKFDGQTDTTFDGVSVQKFDGKAVRVTFGPDAVLTSVSPSKDFRYFCYLSQ